ncbi:hypothetical protein B0T20DRAFT_357077 [Sordaria brevicollis]|uniref:Uncharacterized protein n=1 Tax=Sordaria brevicollis TaxID=83679 RepID=A0AAE0PC67_SORBR|nr:hypothetical protein B0T20DRAFT_357077 [Sordaria brevicollis]
MGGTTEDEALFGQPIPPISTKLGSVMARNKHYYRHQTEPASTKRTIHDFWGRMQPNGRRGLGLYIIRVSSTYIIVAKGPAGLFLLGLSAQASRFASELLLGGIPRLLPSQWMPLTLSQLAKGYKDEQDSGN